MPRKFNARRYARAVFEIALEKNELERWRADLDTIVAALSDETLLAVLESPKIRFEEKSRLVKNIGNVGLLPLNLVLLLITRGGIRMLSQIAEEYRRLVDDYHGIVAAGVVTAVPLDKRDEEKLAQHLSGLTGKKVRLSAAVDPSILGGLIARVGGKLLDGSTRTKLIALKKELAKGAG